MSGTGKGFWSGCAPLAHWFLLAAGAGLINTGGFLACRRFVSHVTGFATMHGIGLAEGNWADAASMASVPLYFLLGCMFAAWVADRRIQKGLNPLYVLPLAVIAAFILGASIGAYVFPHWHYLAFALPAGLALVSAVIIWLRHR